VVWEPGQGQGDEGPLVRLVQRLGTETRKKKAIVSDFLLSGRLMSCTASRGQLPHASIET
jgi:hypothetical protein